MKTKTWMMVGSIVTALALTVGCGQRGYVVSDGSGINKSATTSQVTNGSQQEKQTAASNSEKLQKPTWNTKDIDAKENGNFPIAINLLKSMSDTKSPAEEVDISLVFKAPWNYYGKIIKATGTVGIVQDFPPDSEPARVSGGAASEIVIYNKDMTVVDFYLMDSSGTVKVGDTVSIYGLAVGQEVVENKLGGKTTQLVMAGKQYDKQ
ncbi:hypothetical protein [Tumebacillus flagellatus]|uniref:Lipoprotein n=1 Tax=Tumebacillus flagellatus TaxID=1157490 RepID=A0A074M4N0_9BACL|nr:hypothetical protein [Tumebacillus flagellatus]KEO80967.1 hypothetical protein EL26_23360 [Tumebacillus flagellatus]